MKQRDSFWRAVLDDPDDDAVRLVYADWLDEHGDPARAEFIRLQLTLAAEEPDYDLRAERMLREAELLRANRERWLAEDVPPWLHTHGTWFQRGFAARVRCSAGRFRQSARRLATETVVQQAYLDGWNENAILGFANSPHIARLRGLETAFINRTEDVQRIAEAKSLTDVRSLGLSVGWAGPMPDIPTLLARPHFRNLRQLTMAGGVERIAAGLEHADPPALRELVVRLHSGLEDGALAAMLRSPAISRLTVLHAGILSAVGVRTLAASDLLANLRELRFRDVFRVGLPAALRDFVVGCKLPSLAVLEISDRDIAAVLADSPLADGLRELTLSSTSNEGVAALAASPRLAGLRRLSIPWGRADETVLRLLAASPHLRELRWLGVGREWATDAGLAALNAGPGVPNLRCVTAAGGGDQTILAGTPVRTGYRFAVLITP